jgi:hypothetical protein
MAELGFVEAFKRFGAKLENPMWAVSSIAADGALVLSCWAHYFNRGDTGTLLYVDSLGRWNGNELGNNLLRGHITVAFKDQRLVRMVVATAEDTAAVDHGTDASKIKKTFHIREDMVGRVTEFDGNRFVIVNWFSHFPTLAG